LFDIKFTLTIQAEAFAVLSKSLMRNSEIIGVLGLHNSFARLLVVTLALVSNTIHTTTYMVLRSTKYHFGKFIIMWKTRKLKQ